MLDYVALAEDELARDHDYQAELAAWTMPGARFDGVPAYTHGPRPARDPAPVRDFGRREWDAPFEERPQLVVLTTPGDRPLDWLRAGQALQRVLLVATRLGLATTPISQPVEIPVVRQLLSDPAAGRPDAAAGVAGGRRPAGRTRPGR